MNPGWSAYYSDPEDDIIFNETPIVGTNKTIETLTNGTSETNETPIVGINTLISVSIETLNSGTTTNEANETTYESPTEEKRK